MVALSEVSGMAAIRFLVFGSAERGGRGVVHPRTLFKFLECYDITWVEGDLLTNLAQPSRSLSPVVDALVLEFILFLVEPHPPPKQKKYCSRDSLLKANGNLPNILPLAACSEPRRSSIPTDISPRSWRVWLTVSDKESQASQRIPTQASYTRVYTAPKTSVDSKYRGAALTFGGFESHSRAGMRDGNTFRIPA